MQCCKDSAKPYTAAQPWCTLGGCYTSRFMYGCYYILCWTTWYHFKIKGLRRGMVPKTSHHLVSTSHVDYSDHQGASLSKTLLWEWDKGKVHDGRMWYCRLCEDVHMLNMKVFSELEYRAARLCLSLFAGKA